MNVKWIAHSCFQITTESGKRIVTDPFEDYIGYACPILDADIVTVSHDHKDHNSVGRIRGDYVLIDKPGRTEADGVVVTGFETFHDDCEGRARGKNIAFKFETEGLSLLHMGDIGHIPSEEFYTSVGKIDILFIPVGGTYTIDANQALDVCKRIEPNLIVPMHYKTLFLNMDVESVYKFTDAAGRYFDRSRLGSSSFTITADNMKKRTRIVVMENSLDV